MGARWGWILLAAGMAALIALPWIVPFYLIFVASEILMLGLFAAAFNLLFGYTGMLSFGHAAYFGIGAYTAALLLKHWAVSFLVVLVAAPAAGALLALAIGAMSVKRDEVYFALLTLAFGMMVFAVAHEWRAVTNGSDGITGFRLTPLLPFVPINLAHPANYYHFVLAVVAASLFLLWRITVSPFGLVLQAIRENTERVAFTGVSVYRHRLTAFAISGAFSALAGALYAPFLRVASPELVHWTMSAEPVLMTVVGGARVFLGPLLGAGVFQGLQALITSFTEQWMIYLGAVLVAMVILLPQGLAGLAVRLARRRR